VSELILTGKH